MPRRDYFCSRDTLPRTAQSFANAYGVNSAFGNVEDMLASDDVDIVYVGTPDEMHKQHSLLAIEARKHDLCEKI